MSEHTPQLTPSVYTQHTYTSPSSPPYIHIQCTYSTILTHISCTPCPLTHHTSMHTSNNYVLPHLTSSALLASGLLPSQHVLTIPSLCSHYKHLLHQGSGSRDTLTHSICIRPDACPEGFTSWMPVSALSPSSFLPCIHFWTLTQPVRALFIPTQEPWLQSLLPYTHTWSPGASLGSVYSSGF